MDGTVEMDMNLQQKRTEKILIVDDEPSVRSVIVRTLTTLGYVCDEATDGREALTKIRQNGFSLVISDIKMPNIDGLSLLREAMGKKEDLAFVMITGYGDIHTAVESLKRGAYDYITKPLNLEALSWNVERALENRRLRVENKRARRDLERMVDRKTRELRRKSQQLQDSLDQLKIAQSQLLQSEKMACIGQLAAGVAHEINNPICFVNGNLETSRKYVAKIMEVHKSYEGMMSFLEETQDPHVRSLVRQIQEIEARNKMDFITRDFLDLMDESLEGIERVKKIVRDLSGFTHSGKDEMGDADINECLESTLSIVWNELKYKATVTKSYGDLPRVRCYPQQLNQVFMNILVNAVQAIEKSGEIAIQTRLIHETEWRQDQNRGQVEIKIRDTGHGIPEKYLSRIFDPFFTTKEVGNGVGLGLSMSYDIIQKHNGQIKAESQVGKGTTFTVLLPVDPVE